MTVFWCLAVKLFIQAFFLLLNCICSWWGCHMLVCAFMYAEDRYLHWVSPSITLHVFDIRYLIESGFSLTCLDEWPVPGILLSPFTDWDVRHKSLSLTFTWNKLRSLQCEITLAPLCPVLFQLIFIKVTVIIDMYERCYTLKFVFLSIHMVFSLIYLDL